MQFVIQASDDPIQLISTDLQDIKSYTNVVDTRIGQVIDRLGKMYQSYRAGINMFTHHEDDIMFVITMLQTHYHQLIKYIPQTYQYLVERLYQLSFSYDEIRRYLGAEQPQHYLVILQNTAEKRPNG